MVRRIQVPRSAYIHVPFCAHRCGYCNFTVVAGRNDLVEPFLTAIERELSTLGEPRKIDTLFFGGGTPTQLKGQQLERLLTTVLRWHPLAAGHDGLGKPSYEHEFTSRPIRLTSTPKRFEYSPDYGVTRVSLGAQSFDAAKLRLLERDHQAADIERSVKLLRAAGLAVSLDLIFGVPDESLPLWRNDLEAALRSQPDHISTYGLTYERGADFWRRLHPRRVDAARRRDGANALCRGDRHAHGPRIRALRGLEFRPAGKTLPAQRSLLDGRRILCRRPRGEPLRRRRARDQSPQHNDVHQARARRPIAGR